MIFAGNDGKASEVTDIFAGGVNGKARKISEVYVGDANGKAKKVTGADRVRVTGVQVAAESGGTSGEFFPGDTITLVATVLPENASNKNVAWVSADTSVATVDANGSVTVLAHGITKIRAVTADGGYSAEFDVYANYDMFKVTFNTKFELSNIEAEKCIIDYGDGDSLSFDGEASAITHEFGDANDHQITIYGFDFDWFAFTNNKKKGSYIRTVDSALPPMSSFVNPDRTSYRPFNWCTGLVSVHPDLFDNNTDKTDFSNFFETATHLTSVPATLFDKCRNAQNFNGTFYNCSGYTGYLPELWDTTKWPNVTEHSQCFTGCTNAANYADVPEGWK